MLLSALKHLSITLFFTSIILNKYLALHSSCFQPIILEVLTLVTNISPEIVVLQKQFYKYLFTNLQINDIF